MSSRRGPDAPGESRRRQSLGKAGERVARLYLESEGFQILWTNYRRRDGEIDIAARRGRLLVFCEVKTRIGSGDPREGYGTAQRARLVKLSEAFLAQHEETLPAEYDLRYDLIVVGRAEGRRLEVKEHIPDAFRP